MARASEADQAFRLFSRTLLARAAKLRSSLGGGVLFCTLGGSSRVSAGLDDRPSRFFVGA